MSLIFLTAIDADSVSGTSANSVFYMQQINTQRIIKICGKHPFYGFRYINYRYLRGSPRTIQGGDFADILKTALRMRTELCGGLHSVSSLYLAVL